MALKKETKQADGVATSYHRILSLSQTVNHHNSISVLSYVDEAAREAEVNQTIAQPYKAAVTYETEYNEAMTIETAYDFLKTLPEFEGAEDV